MDTYSDKSDKPVTIINLNPCKLLSIKDGFRILEFCFRTSMALATDHLGSGIYVPVGRHGNQLSHYHFCIMI